jgi:K+-transporting ATPase KdpF subunit
LWWANCTPTGVKNSDFMETIIVTIVALALFVYLFIAMVYPEKF